MGAAPQWGAKRSVHHCGGGDEKHRRRENPKYKRKTATLHPATGRRRDLTGV